MKIGFIGQGYIGGNMADDYEKRGYEVVRYSLDEKFVSNGGDISSCDIVFIAVPTPTTPEGPDHSIVEKTVGLAGPGKIIVIKSTIVPGTTRKIQQVYPDRIVLFSPEFLSKATAAYDAANPICNTLGLLSEEKKYTDPANLVMGTLPKSKNNFIVSAEAAELFKYAHNVHGYMRVVFSNILYDATRSLNVEWSEMEPMLNADPMMSAYYNSPMHSGGRGAGGCCFIKDMAAFRSFYEDLVHDDELGIGLLKAFEKKNLSLLAETDKDKHIINEVYGDENNSNG